jgi:hypothetical protein
MEIFHISSYYIIVGLKNTLCISLFIVKKKYKKKNLILYLPRCLCALFTCAFYNLQKTRQIKYFFSKADKFILT